MERLQGDKRASQICDTNIPVIVQPLSCQLRMERLPRVCSTIESARTPVASLTSLQACRLGRSSLVAVHGTWPQSVQALKPRRVDAEGCLQQRFDWRAGGIRC